MAIKAGIENAEAYTSHRLKMQLQKELTEMSLISQIGLSNLVCSSDMNVGVAVKTVKELSVVANGTNDKLHLQHSMIK